MAAAPFAHITEGSGQRFGRVDDRKENKGGTWVPADASNCPLAPFALHSQHDSKKRHTE